MTAAFPSGSNTYVRSLKASDSLVVSYARNPKDFALNRYCQIKPVQKDEGLYLSITAEMAARLLNTNLASETWSDGNVAPEGNEGLESFEFLAYKTKRFAYSFVLGDKAVNQADWQILESHAAIHAQRAMTARTLLAYGVLSTSGNYGANTIDVDDVPGTTGDWGAATGSNLNIKKSFNYGVQAIEKSTLATVKREDLVCVMGPGGASVIADSPELQDYLKQSPYAQAQVQGRGPNINVQYGLPEELYGIPLVVENAVRVSSNKNATLVRDYIWGTNNIALLARSGGMVNEAPSKTASFSSITCFEYEGMTVESKRDDDNRRTKGRVVDDVGFVMTAPASSFLFTGIDD